MIPCPCCGQVVVVPTANIVIDAYRLPNMEACVLRAVWRGKGHPVMAERIFDLMYADDPDGGPSPGQMYSTFKVSLSRLRKRIRGSGVSIENVGYRRGYRLVIGEKAHEISRQYAKRNWVDDGLNLTTAFSQAQSQLEAVGITTTGKEGSQREAAAKRIAQFQNALAAEMEAFKQAQNGKAPTQVDIQSMVNRLLLPVVIRTTNPGDLGYGVWPNPLEAAANLFGSSPNTDALAFEARMRPDGSTVDVPMEYSDIPIDFRRTIASDLERELGRIPSRRQVVQRYRDFVLDRDPTPIEQVEPMEPSDAGDLLINRLLRPIAAVPAFALTSAGAAVELITGTSENSEAGRDRDASLDRFLDGDPLTGGN